MEFEYKFEIGETVRIKENIEEVMNEVWANRKVYKPIRDFMISKSGETVQIKDKRANEIFGESYSIGDGFAWDARFLEKVK